MNERALALFRRIILALIREFKRDRNYVFVHFDSAYYLDNPDEGKLEKGKEIADEVLASEPPQEQDPNAPELPLGRVDKRDSHPLIGMIQAGICDGDQLGTRPDVGRGVGVL